MKLLEIKVRRDESPDNPYNPKKMTPKELIDWCEKNSPNYLKRMRDNLIFRGFKSSAPIIGMIDTNKMNRVSANTHNYYTLWMDNDPKWAEYPKRSKSIICSTSRGTAHGFGNPMFIIPADKCKIGVCSAHDLWDSFGEVSKNLNYDMLSDFMHNVHKILVSINGGDIADNEAQLDYSTLITLLKEATLKKMERLTSEETPYSNRIEDAYPEAMKKLNCRSLYDLWVRLMDPKKNNFSVTTAEEFTTQYKSEIWIQGECAVLESNYITGHGSIEIDTELLAFAKKYFI